MLWFILGACALALVVILALVMTFLRFNQLSMARSLCDEAKRQLIIALRARHALVPSYIGTLQQITTSDLGPVELALASAERAPFGPRGAAAESALTRAVDDAAQIPSTVGDRAGAGDSTPVLQTSPREELDTTVELLHGQLTVLTERIVSGARIYNTNVERYHRQRELLLSRLFQNVFKAREPFSRMETQSPSEPQSPTEPPNRSEPPSPSDPAGS